MVQGGVIATALIHENAISSNLWSSPSNYCKYMSASRLRCILFGADRFFDEYLKFSAMT